MFGEGAECTQLTTKAVIQILAHSHEKARVSGGKGGRVVYKAIPRACLLLRMHVIGLAQCSLATLCSELVAVCQNFWNSGSLLGAQCFY